MGLVLCQAPNTVIIWPCTSSLSTLASVSSFVKWGHLPLWFPGGNEELIHVKSTEQYLVHHGDDDLSLG